MVSQEPNPMNPNIYDVPGSFDPVSNTILLSYEHIADLVRNTVAPIGSIDLSTVISQILLHELAHVLIDEIESKTPKVRTQILNPVARMQPYFQQFDELDLKEIQEFSQPRPRQ